MLPLPLELKKNMNERYRVLVVDKSDDIIECLTHSLQPYQYIVEGVTSTQTALQMLSDQQYDIVITDVHMPGISGLELLRRVKTTLDTQLPVILITGQIETEHAVEAVRLGAADFIGKPIDMNELLRSMDYQLKKKNQKSVREYAADIVKDIHLDFEYFPSRFVERDLSTLTIRYLQNIYDIPPAVANALQLCLDEMLHNAFIHGTLQLTTVQRELPHEKYIALIDELTRDPGIHSKAIYLSITLSTRKRIIRITVSDQGNGFDYERFMTSPEDQINLDSSGRGIRFLRVLCDDIAFSDNGSTVTIEKKF